MHENPNIVSMFCLDFWLSFVPKSTFKGMKGIERFSFVRSFFLSFFLRRCFWFMNDCNERQSNQLHERFLQQNITNYWNRLYCDWRSLKGDDNEGRRSDIRRGLSYVLSSLRIAYDFSTIRSCETIIFLAVAVYLLWIFHIKRRTLFSSSFASHTQFSKA